MKLNTILPLIVTVFIAVVLIAVTIVPVVEQAQHEQHDVMMNSGERYSLASTKTDVTLSVIDGEPAFNGSKLSEIFDLPTVDTRYYVISDKLIARGGYVVNSATWSPWTVQSLAFDTLTNRIFNMTSDIEITFTNGTFTATNSASSASWTEFTGTYNYLMVPDKDGSYGAFLRAELPKFVDSDSTIYVVDSLSTAFTIASGTLANMHIDSAFGSGAEITDGGLTAQYTPTEYDASNSLSGFTRIGTVSYSASTYVFVPLEYSVISQDQSITIAMLGIIPLLALLIPIILIMRGFSVGRD